MAGSRYTKHQNHAQIIYNGASDVSEIAKGILFQRSVTINGDNGSQYTIPIGKTMANTNYQVLATLSGDLTAGRVTTINRIDTKTTTQFNIILSNVVAVGESVDLDYCILGEEA